MKIPFSYRQHIFGTVLFASLAGHVICLSAGSFFSSKPEYGVEHGPSSMEVILLKTSAPRKEKLSTGKVLSIKDSTSETPRIFERKEDRSEQKEISKSVYIPPAKGAETEAKPVYLKNQAPLYPELARERGWEGVVVLKILVSKEGLVHQIDVDKSSGYKILDESALKAIHNWKFSPARV